MPKNKFSDCKSLDFHSVNRETPVLMFLEKIQSPYTLSAALPRTWYNCEESYHNINNCHSSFDRDTMVRRFCYTEFSPWRLDFSINLLLIGNADLLSTQFAHCHYDIAPV